MWSLWLEFFREVLSLFGDLINDVTAFADGDFSTEIGVMDFFSGKGSFPFGLHFVLYDFEIV